MRQVKLANNSWISQALSLEEGCAVTLPVGTFLGTQLDRGHIRLRDRAYPRLQRARKLDIC